MMGYVARVFLVNVAVAHGPHAKGVCHGAAGAEWGTARVSNTELVGSWLVARLRLRKGYVQTDCSHPQHSSDFRIHLLQSPATCVRFPQIADRCVREREERGRETQERVTDIVLAQHSAPREVFLEKVPHKGRFGHFFEPAAAPGFSLWGFIRANSAYPRDPRREPTFQGG